jgi:hypothetical protein
MSLPLPEIPIYVFFIGFGRLIVHFLHEIVHITKDFLVEERAVKTAL